ncbi:phage tail protein [Synechococcales cyanobacterium C]|uniref:Phage tail protein n=1 Tax=Petrachloros mirabilis ULC683 TaxID=2781853 RepID=A0A8K2A9C5_9CYAN|nr:tail fiber protein [Petrachloros mirabilis]NCJ08050.1 phage tail protein [Petrachloros mirabilis ULC683]
MDPFIGQIQAFGFNFPPRGWAFCDGQLLSISSNEALFSLLGTTFGGDGRTTFALPDLRGRSIVHVGSGPGLDTITWGERGGTFEVTLTIPQMASHSHTAILHGENALADSPDPLGRMLAAPQPAGTNIYASPVPAQDRAMASESIVVDDTGGSQPLNIRNPFLGVYVSIALVGIFPSRN